MYRRLSSTLDELAQFTNEFKIVTQNMRKQHIKAYLCGDYNINLLKPLRSENHTPRFYHFNQSLRLYIL